MNIFLKACLKWHLVFVLAICGAKSVWAEDAGLGEVALDNVAQEERILGEQAEQNQENLEEQTVLNNMEVQDRAEQYEAENDEQDELDAEQEAEEKQEALEEELRQKQEEERRSEEELKQEIEDDDVMDDADDDEEEEDEEEAENEGMEGDGESKVKQEETPEDKEANFRKEVQSAAKQLASADTLTKTGKLKEAIAIYKELLKNPILEVRIEALFKLGNIALNVGAVDTAIKYYETILKLNPHLFRIRLELAKAYLLKDEWWTAKYHFRLIATDKNLPPEVRRNIAVALYQNKNWHFWFNVGAIPDDNVNNAVGGEQCVATVFGILCNKLPEKEKAKGFNVAFGGDYEFKLSNHWRLRNEATFWSSLYDKKEYDDLYLSYSVGPKYVWDRANVFIGPSAYRRWLGHRPYNYAIGGLMKINYDVTNHMSLGLNLSYMPTKYDEYSDELDGYTTGFSSNIFYGFDASKYIMLRTGYTEERTNNTVYSNDREFYAIGYGQELPWGFSIYLEPSVQVTKYKEARWFVKDLDFHKIKEKAILKKYSFSISNKKLSLLGFSPMFTYTYTDKDSNVWQHKYEKENFELTLQQKF